MLLKDDVDPRKIDGLFLGCFRKLCFYLPSSAVWLIAARDARFPRGGEPPRRKRLHESHLSRYSKQESRNPFQST
jgi:hypothetical protein